MRSRLAIVSASLVATAALLACSPQDRAAVKGEAARTADSAGKAVDSAGRAANQAGSAVSETVSDASITAKVKSALLADEQVKGMRINVDTANQVVTLTGDAQNGTEKQRAEQLALQVDGVKSVHNNINVTTKSAANKGKG